jgi:hypothetical protein
MVPAVPTPQAIFAEIALVEELIAQGETIVQTVGTFVEALHALKAPAPAPVAEPVPAAPAAPAAMPLDHASMENYDAEQLVTIRHMLAGGQIDDPQGIVAHILERRLGSSKP